jgi:hypothetical protein
MEVLDELINDIRHPQFTTLPVSDQADVINTHLGRLYGSQYSDMTPDKKQQMIQFALSEYLPKSMTEKVLTHVPLVGPFIEQYGYGRIVKPSPLAGAIIGEEFGNKYGAIVNFAEDAVLLGAAIGTLGLAAPGILAGTAFEGMSILANSFIREAAIGSVYEVGKLITTPPSSLTEAGERVAIGGLAGGILGAGGEAAWATLRGRFGELLGSAGNKATAQRFRREFGSEEAVNSFWDRVNQAHPGDITDEDLAHMYNIVGNRTSEAAQDLRQATDLMRDQRNRYREIARDRLSEQEARTEQFRRQREGETLREQRLSEAEIKARQESRDQYERKLDNEQEATEALFGRYTPEPPPVPEFEHLGPEQDYQLQLERNAQQTRLQAGGEILAERTAAEVRASRIEAELREASIATQEQEAIKQQNREFQQRRLNQLRSTAVAEQAGRQDVIQRRLTEEERLAEVRAQRSQQVSGARARLENERLEALNALEERAPTNVGGPRNLPFEAERQEVEAAIRSRQLTARQQQELELENIQREVDLVNRERQAHQLMQENENTRVQAVNEELAGVERTRRTEVRPTKTTSEQMLSDLLTDPQAPRNGFIGDRPVTTPIGMIHNGEPVIVERMHQNTQAVIRGKGIVGRAELREAQTLAEQQALSNLLRKENVNPLPSRTEAESILRSRVAAEQAIRQADLHQLRPDFGSNNQAQTQEFNLRRGAAESLVSAANREFSQVSLDALHNIEPLVGNRLVGSLDSIPNVIEAGDLMNALGGSGFNNVRMAVSPKGEVSLTFTRGTSELENLVSQLHTTNNTHLGIVDPTKRTYNGLDVDEHEILGQAFGLSKRNIDRYKNFINQTLDDANSRAIRVPVAVETLGVDPLEQQVRSKITRAMSIRPDAIVDAERLQTFEKGDWLTVDIADKNITAQVVDMVPFKSQTRPMMAMLHDEKNQFIGIFTQEQLQAANAKREVTRVIGNDPQVPLNLYSPARSLEALLNPESRTAPLRPVDSTQAGIRQGANELGMRTSFNSHNGDVSVTLNGTKLTFSGPSSLEDAARLINGMRQLAKEKLDSIQSLGGPGCLR